MMVKNPELLPLFGELKSLLKPYARHFTVRKDEPGYYDLWSERDLVIADRKRKEVFFAGLIIQKSYVGFYYMPIYADVSAEKFFGPELLSLLKGKSCFYIRELTPVLRTQIEDALAGGLAMYKERGWV
ncbi:MAG: DUF1801 domain-containing protein [Coriobacteriia bacterium]|nr:DUF1801 domain-containing protein [Coriobacteriia bacterium]MBN2823180.1 DUF1801 domain-containing protein [Coriobacteriia bacterium]